MSKLKFGSTRTGDTIRSERTASVEPIIRIVRPNALERIQISGLDIKVSGGERDFRALKTFNPSSPVLARASALLPGKSKLRA
jgi:hypothetical protein